MNGNSVLPIVRLDLTYGSIFCYNTYEVWTSQPIDTWYNCTGLAAIQMVTTDPEYREQCPGPWTLMFSSDTESDNTSTGNLKQIWSVSGVVTGSN